MSSPDRTPAIVLVEDEQGILQLLTIILRSLRPTYAVLPVARGADALALIGQRPVPLVITDYNMPDMDGLELAAAIKAAAPTTHIVMITAYPTPALEKTALAQGIDAFLAKPFLFERMETIVQALLP
jgi:two-component system, response regulator, stage 0 sporulation protein F